MKARHSTSLFAFIVEAIDEALPPDSASNGREIYLRGFERFYRHHAEKRLAEQRAELEKALPLLAPTSDETVEF